VGMGSLYSSRLSHRSLFLLYGASALTLLVFGLIYAYAHRRGWNHSYAVFLGGGVIAALLVWSRVESRLLVTTVVTMNYDSLITSALSVNPGVVSSEKRNTQVSAIATYRESVMKPRAV
jgi:hypothetical protein